MRSEQTPGFSRGEEVNDYSTPEYLPPSRLEREQQACETIDRRWRDEQNRRRSERSRANMKRANGQRPTRGQAA